MTDVDSDEHIGMLVRPYALTGGRTRAAIDIAIEALLTTTPGGMAAGTQLRGITDQHVLAMCARRAVSLAEVAALTRLPLGVARILVSDLIVAGLLAFAGQTLSGNRSTDVLGRLLAGLRRL